jgi:hypothetical protein
VKCLFPICGRNNDCIAVRLGGIHASLSWAFTLAHQLCVCVCVCDCAPSIHYKTVIVITGTHRPLPPYTLPVLLSCKKSRFTEFPKRSYHLFVFLLLCFLDPLF